MRLTHIIHNLNNSEYDTNHIQLCSSNRTTDSSYILTLHYHCLTKAMIEFG